MTRRKGQAVWLTRDKNGGMYNLHYKKPTIGGDVAWDYDDCFCSEAFERITGYTLKPGAGPVKVRIPVERVVERRRDG